MIKKRATKKLKNVLHFNFGQAKFRCLFLFINFGCILGARIFWQAAACTAILFFFLVSIAFDCCFILMFFIYVKFSLRCAFAMRFVEFLRQNRAAHFLVIWRKSSFVSGFP